MSNTLRHLRRRGRPLVAVLACALVLPGASGAAAAGSRLPASATLEQCVTSVAITERSATFAGEMVAIPGTARMQMRIELLERMPGEALFHPVTFPGLGVWRSPAPGVKIFKNLSRVSGLTAPASYRGAVRFRWLNAKGRLLRSLELRTPRCGEPAPPASAGTHAGVLAPTGA